MGDFFGDGFEDIVLTDAKGELVILDNNNGKLARIKATMYSESGSLDGMRGFIQQLKVFDMDNDGKDDIVLLDDSGEISILYGRDGSGPVTEGGAIKDIISKIGTSLADTPAQTTPKPSADTIIERITNSLL